MNFFEQEIRREAEELLRLVEATEGRFVWTSARAGQSAPNITSDPVALLAEASRGTLSKLLLPAVKQLAEETGSDGKVFLFLVLRLLLLPWEGREPLRPLFQLPDIFHPKTPEELEGIALSSGLDSKLAHGLAEAVWSLGEGGVITLESDPGREVKVRQEAGYEVDFGVESETLGLSAERSLDGPLVAVVNSALTRLEDVQELLEVASQFGSPLVLVSLGLYGQARKTVLLNDRKGVMTCMPVRAGGSFTWKKQEVLQDLCALTGATLIDPTNGVHSLKKIAPAWFGGAARVTGTRTRALFLMPEERPDVGDRSSAIDHWISQVCNSDFDREWAEKRRSMLSDGLCVLRVGADSEAERQVRKASLARGIRMLRAGIEHGFIRGSAWYLLPRVMTTPCPLWAEVLKEATARSFGRGVTSVAELQRSVELAHSIACTLRNTAVCVSRRQRR